MSQEAEAVLLGLTSEMLEAAPVVVADLDKDHTEMAPEVAVMECLEAEADGLAVAAVTEITREVKLAEVLVTLVV